MFAHCCNCGAENPTPIILLPTGMISNCISVYGQVLLLDNPYICIKCVLDAGNYLYMREKEGESEK